MIDQATLDRASAAILASGIRVLQGYRLAPTEAAHVRKLLQFMRPPPETTVVDVGSGFGEVARIMHSARPDLGFILLNNNAFQLANSPAVFHRVQGDMHRMPLGPETADTVMLCYTLCHADSFPQVFSEAARVSTRRGRMFIYDYERLRGNNRLFRTRLHARAMYERHVAAVAHKSGWELCERHNPPGSDDLFRTLYDNDEEYSRIFKDITPVIWIFRRE